MPAHDATLAYLPRKWNERLFLEMYEAYQHGRMSKDPSIGWYHDELAFFDNYIIPLAKKLKECNIFGVSSDQCLNYAVQNRAESEQRGGAIVQQLMDKAKGKTNTGSRFRYQVPGTSNSTVPVPHTRYS